MTSHVRLLHLILITPRSLPALLIGPPGVGKSTVIDDIARANHWYRETVLASIREPADFLGLPVPDGNGSVSYAPPSWVRRLVDAGEGILFLDDLSTAAPMTQNALLRVAIERVVGEVHLPEGVRVVAAMNPPDMINGFELTPALSSRFVHLPFPGPSNLEWARYLTEGSAAVQQIPTMDLPTWTREWGLVRGLLSAFHTRHQGLLLEDPSKVAGRATSAWASPRTWEAAGRLLATARVTGDEDAVLPLLSGCVGEAVALEFATWLRGYADLPDPEVLMVEAELWKPKRGQDDRVFVTLIAVAHAATEDRGRVDFPQRWVRAWAVLLRAMDLGSDIVVPAARILAAFTPDRPLDAQVVEVLRRLAPILNLIGSPKSGAHDAWERARAQVR